MDLRVNTLLESDMSYHIDIDMLCPMSCCQLSTLCQLILVVKKCTLKCLEERQIIITNLLDQPL